MQRVLACLGGFLVGVIWMDLMFDTQVLGHPVGDLPEDVLRSIADYYRRVTTEADPMGRFVGVAMIATLAGVTHQLLRGVLPLWLRIVAGASATVPIAFALLRVFPHAVRLAGRADSTDVQSALARSICSDHLLSLGSMLVFVAIQLFAGRRATAMRIG